jgi:anti-sigma regulatory factor (Ser/Thr protein kinase)
MPEVRLILEVDTGEPEVNQVKRIALSSNCRLSDMYVATNAVMEEMRNRIKTAHNRELTGGAA